MTKAEVTKTTNVEVKSEDNAIITDKPKQLTLNDTEKKSFLSFIKAHKYLIGFLLFVTIIAGVFVYYRWSKQQNTIDENTDSMQTTHTNTDEKSEKNLTYEIAAKLQLQLKITSLFHERIKKIAETSDDSSDTILQSLKDRDEACEEIIEEIIKKCLVVIEQAFKNNNLMSEFTVNKSVNEKLLSIPSINLPDSVSLYQIKFDLPSERVQKKWIAKYGDEVRWESALNATV